VFKHLLAGAACVALLGVAAPASAASGPEMPGMALQSSPISVQGLDSFYARRGNAPLWLGSNTAAASALISVLERSSLDGFAEGPTIARQVQALIARGDTAAADRLLSAGWVGYVETLQRPPLGVTYVDKWLAPQRQTAAQIIAQTASAPSLAQHVQSIARVNPLYARIRDAAWSQMQAGGSVDPRVLISLDRVREMPSQHKYVMVDAAAARLYMIQDGQIVDSMRVAVGKPGEETQTPMLASTIYYATVNPYWHVTDELVQSLIAKNVLQQGLGYLTSHGYQVMPADENDDTLLNPAKIDWHAVAAGDLKVRVRQLPGPANSMGKVKFGFRNDDGIYLHDTPNKDLFGQDDRTVSHGCIRLEDAQRLEHWALDGAQPMTAGAENNVLLPTPLPIYITYLTAQAHDGQLTFIDDVYGRDASAMQVASLR